MTRLISFWVLVAIIVLVGVAFYRVMSGFLLPLFLAVLLAVIFEPVYAWLVPKCKQRRHLAAGLATATVVLIVFIPAGFVLMLAATEGISAVKEFNVGAINRAFVNLRHKFDLQIPLANEFREIETTMSGLRYQATSDDAVAHNRSALGKLSNLLELLSQELAQLPEKDERVDEAALREQLAAVRANLAKLRDWPPSARVPEPSAKPAPSTNPATSDTPGTTGETVGGEPIESPDYDLLLREFSHEYEDFHVAALGGPMRAWLKEKANPSAADLQKGQNQLLTDVSDALLPVANATTTFAVKLIFGTVIMVVSVFFFFVDGEKMVVAIMRLIPLDVRHQQELLDEFGRISRAVVLATLLSAVVQGLLAGIGFWFAGVSSVFLLMLITMVFAMIPFVGALAAWVPVCLWLYIVEERTTAAVLLAIYCAIIVSQSDNVVKPLILQGRSKLHPLLALLSILGGVQSLGPIGILIGPMLVVFLQTLLNMLHRELTSLEQTAKAAADPAPQRNPPAEPAANPPAKDAKLSSESH